MTKQGFASLGIAMACLLSAAPVWAHGAHCHVKAADGTLTDFPEAKDQKSCEAKGGTWKHHHAHCHKVSDGHVDLKDAKNEKACLAEGGKWADHGHEAALAE